MSRISKKIRKLIFNIENPKILCIFVNIYTRFRSDWKFSVHPVGRFLKVVDRDGRSIYILHGIRLGFYKSGVKARVDDLMSAYMIDLDKIEEGDCIIDCGANIGELGVSLFLNKKNANYISFELGALEYQACARNNTTSRNENAALWYENGELKFYEKSNTADSSAIETSFYNKVTVVKATRLDDFCKSEGIGRVKYLKIEAEGAEPEVLEGAVETLRRTQYVCVDCGFERGKEQASTLPQVTRFLSKHGFLLTDVNPRRLTVLFVNTTQ